MPLSPVRVTDTRPLFRPFSAELLALLQTLSPKDWLRPTVAGAWLVRDVVAHLVDGQLRRLSMQRDQLPLPPPPHPIRADREFVAFINGLNASAVTVAKRYSPRVLTELFAVSSTALADFFESAPLDATSLGVSWAGEEASVAWFDIGRDFTELWHHDAQIRLALEQPPKADPLYLRAVLAIAVRALPHAYRQVPVKDGSTISIQVTGPSGGFWTLERESTRWTIWEGSDDHPITRIRIVDEVAGRLLFNGINEKDAPEQIEVEGRLDLARPFLRARSVIV